MKTKFYTLMILFICFNGIGQVASINEKQMPIKPASLIIDPNIAIWKSHYIKIIGVIDAEIIKQQAALILITGDKTKMDSISDLIETQIKIKVKMEKERDKKLASFDNKYKAWLPTKKSEDRKSFFESIYSNDSQITNYLNSFSLNASQNNVTVQSEVVTDYIHWFRISLGTLVAAESNTSTTDTATSKAETVADETQEQALSRLINGGGNFYLDLVLPLLTTHNGKTNDLLTGYLFANNKLATDIKGFGNNIDTSTFNGNAGLNGYLGASSVNKNFNFFMQANINYVYGSKDFYKNLALTDEKGFLSGKFIAGVTLMNKFKVSAIINTFGSDEKLRSGKVILGLQVLP